MNHCVIMAGGAGTRFWPRSRENKSKQFLEISGEKSMFAATVDRFEPLFGADSLYVVAIEHQWDELKKANTVIPNENIILEPAGRNTAPCVGLSAIEIRRRDKDAIMIVSPCDHLIGDLTRFQQDIEGAIELASEQECIVIIGIKPENPSVSYGYIQVDELVGEYNGTEAYSVKTFAEKPNPATAVRFLNSGDFFWNSGIFVFQVEAYIKALKKHMPDLHRRLLELEKVQGSRGYKKCLRESYENIRNASIDYGIMEHCEQVFMLKGGFPWCDLGSWNTVYRLSEKDKDGNSLSGNVQVLDSRNSHVYAPHGLVALVGLEDVIVIQEEDVTLICSRDKSHRVKDIVDQMKKRGLKKYI